MKQKKYRKKKQIGIVGSPTHSDGTGKAIFFDSPDYPFVGQRVIVEESVRKIDVLCELSNPRGIDPTFRPGGINFMLAVAGKTPIETNTRYAIANYKVIGEIIEAKLIEKNLRFPLCPRSKIFTVGG